ncbi:MAG: extracellular solute-binding protein [Anaerolineales bacterium]
MAFRLTAFLALIAFVSACAPAVATPVPPQVIKETVVVPQEVTRVVEQELIVTATALPIPEVSGRLVVYTSRSESLFQPVVEAFTEQYPKVEIVVLTGSNGELAAKLLEEQKNPQADVLVNSDTLTMEDLASKGLFAPNFSEVVAAVPDAYRAEDGNWVALTLRPRVIMYNTDLVKPEDLPQSIFDLTDPKWKGQIGSANSTNGALVGQLVAMRALVGEAKTEQWIRDFVANEVQFFGGHTEVRQAVGAGELKLGLVNHYYYHLSKAEGAPVGVIYPDQNEGQMGLIVNSTNAGIINGGPNPAAAQAFVDFMLAPRGQRLFAQANFEYPITPDVALADGVPSLSNFRQAEITLKLLWDELEPTRALIQSAGLP